MTNFEAKMAAFKALISDAMVEAAAEERREIMKMVTAMIPEFIDGNAAQQIIDAIKERRYAAR